LVLCTSFCSAIEIYLKDYNHPGSRGAPVYLDNEVQRGFNLREGDEQLLTLKTMDLYDGVTTFVFGKSDEMGIQSFKRLHLFVDNTINGDVVFFGSAQNGFDFSNVTEDIDGPDGILTQLVVVYTCKSVGYLVLNMNVVVKLAIRDEETGTLKEQQRNLSIYWTKECGPKTKLREGLEVSFEGDAVVSDGRVLSDWTSNKNVIPIDQNTMRFTFNIEKNKGTQFCEDPQVIVSDTSIATVNLKGDIHQGQVIGPIDKNLNIDFTCKKTGAINVIFHLMLYGFTDIQIKFVKECMVVESHPIFATHSNNL